MTVPTGSGRSSLTASTEQLLDSAPDGFVIIDKSGLIRLVNRQAERMFGYRRDELVGQPIETLVPDNMRHVHPRHREKYFMRPAARPMGAGLQLAARRKDGTEFPVDISLSSLDTDDGMLVSAAVRDITDRKRAEEEQARLESRLLQAQRDEERAVLEAQLHQAQRLESVGQLAGGIAHDFNNLLAGIMNYAALVADGIRDKAEALQLVDDEDFTLLAADVGEITNVARRAADLTHQLLIFSRREVVQPEILDLNGIVDEMDRLLARTIGERIVLTTRLQPGLPAVMADRGQIEQILMNLAVNARDAMPAGGRLTIETSTFDADEDYAASRRIAAGSYVRLTVADSGAGMPADVKTRAFEPFFTTKAKGEGSGLGLATVYGIVTRAAGDVVIYSEAGLGTTIRVHLPVTHSTPTMPRAKSATSTRTGAGETILLVEDEEMIREPARRMLARNGYHVLTASNADEALAIATAHGGTIDLLLTDVVMPGRTGKELATEVRRLDDRITVLFMSGYSHDVIVHQGVLEAGVELIEKPFAPDTLLARVREMLDNRLDPGPR